MRYDFVWKDSKKTAAIYDTTTGRKKEFTKHGKTWCLEKCFEKLFRWNALNAEFLSSPKDTFVFDIPESLKRVYMTCSDSEGTIKVITFFYKNATDLTRSADAAEVYFEKNHSYDADFFRTAQVAPRYETSHTCEFSYYGNH